MLRQKVAQRFPYEDQAHILELLDQYESESAAGRLRVLLLIAALVFLCIGVLQKTTLGERLVLLAVFLLAGVLLIRRIQAGRI